MEPAPIMNITDAATSTHAPHLARTATLESLGRGEPLRSITCEQSLAVQRQSNAARPVSVTLRIVFFALSSGLLFGVDLGSIAGALDGLTKDLRLTTVQAEAVVSGAKGGAIFGCLLGGSLMALQGRRTVVALSSLPFIVGPMILGLSSSFWEALVARLLMGIGVGMASVAAPCFLSEVAPASSRGSFVSLYEIAVALGFLITAVANYLIEGQHDCYGGCWRYMGGLVPLAAAFPMLLAACLLPESPRWLLSAAGGDKKLLRGALEAMHRLGCAGVEERLKAIDAHSLEAAHAAPCWAASEDDLVALWDEHHAAVGHPLLLSEEEASARPASVAAPSQLSAVRTFVTTIADAGAMLVGASSVPAGASRGLLLALLAAILNQACASTSVLVYAQQLLKEAGIHSAAVQDSMAIAVALAKAVGTLLGLLIVNRIGRRPLLGWGGVLTTLSIGVLSVGSVYKNAFLLLAGICSFILVFVATWGLGYWIVVTEVTAAGGPRYGGAAQAVATTALFAAGWVTDLTFQSVTDAGGPWALMTYAGVTALGALYALCLLPELRGLPLELCAERVKQMPIEAWLARCHGSKSSSKSTCVDCQAMADP
eukprot:TRINITY_DN2610_c0_g1_i1.p1 TRINITY_DN2610_c0_g1~~TRINITY_DN2610_c0_g1_i1.p1  ORF type:complete len:598 (+),score=101.33 TRINITY_DN2610_c0_g1_i1:84-1877(+)